MRGKLAALLLAMVLIAGVSANAMAENFWGITYDISIPDQDMQDYISATSYRGFGLEWRWQTESDAPLLFGFSMAWHVFSQRLDGTQMLENGAITGIQDRYLNSFPFLLNAFYYFGSPRGTQLYFGAGAGAQYVIQRMHIGVNVLEETNWHFAVQPQVGLLLPFGGDVKGLFAFKYDYAFEAGEYIGGEKRDWQYYVISLGLMYSYW